MKLQIESGIEIELPITLADGMASITKEGIVTAITALAHGYYDKKLEDVLAAIAADQDETSEEVSVYEDIETSED